MKETMISLTIHLLVPLAGFSYFLYLIVRMIRGKVPKPPIISLFIIFANYGMLLLLLLTELFWKWSGAALLGVVFFFVSAPVSMLIMSIIAFTNWRRRAISKYHKWTFIFALAYLFILPSILVAVFIFVRAYS